MQTTAELRWSGEFTDPEVERRFVAERLAGSGRTLSIAALVAAGAFVAFIPTDLILMGAGPDWLAVAAVRASGAASLAVGAWLLRSRPAWVAGPAGQRAVTAVELVCIAAFLAVCVLRPLAVTNLHLSTVCFGTSALLFVPGPLPRRAALIGGFYGGYGVVVATVFDHSLAQTVPLVGSLALALAGATIATASLNRSERLAHVRLTRRASEDFLTGLPNRRAFFAGGERLVDDDVPLAAVVVDVDAFKLLNDEQGHAAGDEALQALAASLRGALAAGDIAGRLGGEEFGALVVDVDDEGALAVADRIRAAVEDSGVTVSVGVAARRPEETLDALLRRADMAMYRAKRRGGNAATLG